MDAPLCVDLDGTLIKSNLLFESLILLLKKNPLNSFLCLFWLMVGGRAYLKQQIAIRVHLNPALLPYTQNFLTYLQHEKAKGRHIALITAADKKMAAQVADHLGLFAEVLASDGRQNLKGKHKRDLLNKKFGTKQYDYAGNHKDDLAVWLSARSAILVNPKKNVVRQSKKMLAVEKIFADEKNNLINVLKSLRVHQYVKNFLVFVPILTGHLYFNNIVLAKSLLAFIIFCFLASSVYLLNDLLDLESDRQHKVKCRRAFAAGDIPISFGLICAPLFLVLACALSLFLPMYFIFCILGYYLLTIVYSFYLKRKVLIDVFALSTLYTIRIVAGITAASSEYSPWLISFSIFLFLSLALVKRFAELEFTRQENKLKAIGREYLVSDSTQLQIFGTISGYISVLVLALYINSEKISALYQFSMPLWFICLLLLYWISRIWMLTARGQLNDDPVIFALKDKVSWLVLLISAAIIIIDAK